MQAESNRQLTLRQLDLVIREATALGQMFSATVAAKVGLGGADLEYLDMVTLKGRMTAGELAAATGLTTGAVTGLIDRLERAGFVRRERDEEDRRRVFVVVLPEPLARLREHYRPMTEALAILTERYSDRELATFVDYFARARDLVREALKRAKAED